MRARSTKPSVLINDLELLHAGLGVLMAHYLACHDNAVRHCLALRISRQLRIIAEHRELPDCGLRPSPHHGGALAPDSRMPVRRAAVGLSHGDHTPSQTPAGPIGREPRPAMGREQGIGVLLVLHDLQLASRYADRVIVLKEGRVLTAGPPEHALTRDALFRAYGVEVDILPGPLGELLYPRTAVAAVGDRSV